jgi:hypothetical protein
MFMAGSWVAAKHYVSQTEPHVNSPEHRRRPAGSQVPASRAAAGLLIWWHEL